ncbi:hypothetical protein ILUMI_01000 [Ignelater luminosus]|uniref:O-acyltransferase n=1 Tax=Ignelater luminosus TaxID=2038154 RepID=A0A8K0GPN0_IGNLU|nr:hypothetical protein ILUMI_01000 [Ignelater luminosus]
MHHSNRVKMTKDSIKPIMRENEQGINKLLVSKAEIFDKVKTKPGELPCKQFEARNSLLTDLYEVKHVRTVYHIALATLLGFFLNSVAYDYLQKGEISFGFNLIHKGFVNFHLLIILWLGMFLSHLPVYLGFKCWATIRIKLAPPQSSILNLWDRLCLGLFILYYPGFLYCFTFAATHYGQQIAASMGLLLEMIRMLMKSHAFVRSNAPRVLKYKPHSDKELPYPNFNKFLYFSFAPTLVYQDSYPRTKTIRWNYVAVWFLEFIAGVFFLSFVVDRYFIFPFEHYGLRPYTWQEILIITLGNFATGLLILLGLFYLLLHAWLNAFAEMLRFADRLYYKDWWTSSTYNRYYRTWNVVVHDWLYTYVYKDFYEIVTPKNKVVSKLMVFLLSAIFHDYVLGFGFGFCLPILFFNFFGFGVLFNFYKIKPDMLGNILLWYFNAVGMSMNSVFYSIEYHSRVNCPIENVTIASYFIPRFLSCNK